MTIYNYRVKVAFTSSGITTFSGGVWGGEGGGGWGRVGEGGEEKPRLRLSLAQFQMKLPAGAELGN